MFNKITSISVLALICVASHASLADDPGSNVNAKGVTVVLQMDMSGGIVDLYALSAPARKHGKERVDIRNVHLPAGSPVGFYVYGFDPSKQVVTLSSTSSGLFQRQPGFFGSQVGSDLAASNGDPDLSTTFEFTSPGGIIVTPTKNQDQVTFGIDIKTRETPPKTLYSNPKLLMLDVTKKLTIDFSSGFLFPNNLADKTYYSRPTGIVDVAGKPLAEVVTRKASDMVSPSLGGLVHIYYKTGSPVTPALSAGLAVKNSSVQYFLGGSAIFGSHRRFIVTYGLAWGPTTQFDDSTQSSPAFKPGQPHLPGPFVPDGTQPATVRVFRQSPFVGFTFDL